MSVRNRSVFSRTSNMTKSSGHEKEGVRKMNKKINNIVLWGYYGKNYGDNIMFFQIMNCINQLASDKKIYLISKEQCLDRVCGEKYPRCEVIREDYSNKLERNSWLKKLPQKALHIWGGGTIFTDEDGNFYHFVFLKAHGAKYCYLSSGIGSVTRLSRIFKFKLLLKYSSLTAFRDEKSYEKAKQLSKSNTIVLTDDMVLEYALEYKNKADVYKSAASKYILFSWRNLENFMTAEEQLEMTDVIVEKIKELSRQLGIKKIISIPLDTCEDIKINSIMCNKLNNSTLDVELSLKTDVEDITKLISGASFFISGRLHSSMVAEIMGVPTFTLSYSPKIKYFYESIQKNNYVDVLREPIPPVDVILKSPCGIKNEEELKARTEKSRQNLNLLLDLIEK